MDKKQETQLFENLQATQPRLREWLQAELDQRIEVLMKVLDVEQLRRAQGWAQALQGILTRLDESAVRKR